jgi:amino acid permease
VYFIKENYSAILKNAFDVDIDPNYFALMCFILFTLLCFVRKIEVFASTHVFADVMIALTLVVVVVYGCIEMSANGQKLKTVDFINP